MMSSHSELLIERIANSIEENAEKGIFRCRRDIFTDPELFALEQKYIFEANWVFLAHESQLQNINDYLNVTIGRQPVIITRDKNNELHALINACAHRGATLCRYKKGNKSTFTCPFHGWSFNNTGKLLKAKDEKTGGYPPQFKEDGSHDLKKLAHFENYRGFLFGSIHATEISLYEFLGEARKVIDQIVDQAPQGLEVLSGSSSYTFDGNWKLQTENGADGYHVTSVHWNYVATMNHRKQDETVTKVVDPNAWGKSSGGTYSFENGHMLLWTKLLNPEVRPVYEKQQQLEEIYSKEKVDAIVNQTRNLCLYPNMYIMDQVSTQIRIIRPISVDKTEVTIYCFAPIGEDEQTREIRIRQYEDFFNVSGMGTPDDLEEFRACQEGFHGDIAEWNDLSRGATRWLDGADENAKTLGFNPVQSTIDSTDEGLFVKQHQYWAEQLIKGLKQDQSKTVQKIACKQEA
ncbi:MULTISPECIES: Rieske 2Fe-2S domain-containing protein [Acinetobacter]|uniref:Rieske 2Fe-2S domain-containing protein n=1 Tax=Acinetobacter entericus TaxID=2989714 RepID=A0ABT3NHL2_9GAMM|nr:MULTISPECIES: Rieske 2Fe-2S domain-containing protein [Acinetobacter]MCW8039049.1 Rieske 2Fe-2S domain-containing protein [Acinetobacter entericus]